MLIVRALRIFVTMVAHVSWCAMLMVRCRAWTRHDAATVAGPALARLLEALGPAFIKAGQLLSTRADLLPGPVLESLRLLQDHVTPAPAHSIRDALVSALGSEFDHLKEIEWTPIATGSIAQVIRARLADGRAVAVKVRRPGVAAQVRRDVRLLRSGALIASRLRLFGVMPLVSIAAELAAPLTEQLDFRIEAANSRRLRALFQDVQGVRIPLLVDHLCRESVLVMDYVDDLQRVTSASLTSAERRDAALAGLRALYRMIFIEGFIHADMHDSNVFVRKCGELVILDTGFVARIDTTTRQDFITFFFGMAGGTGAACARIIVDGASRFGPRFDERRFCAEVEQLVQTQQRRNARDFNLPGFVSELFRIQRRWQVRGSTAFIMTVLAMLTFEGICKQLHPDCDFQREAIGYLVAGRCHQPAS